MSFVEQLRRVDLEAWRFRLPDGSRHDVFRAFRQVLAWGVESELATRNTAAGIRNPKRKRHERRDVFPFESWPEVDAIADELDPRYRAIPHRARRNRPATGGVVRAESRRRRPRGRRPPCSPALYAGRVETRWKDRRLGADVPLRARVLGALDAMPVRIDTPVLFPAPRGGRIDLEKFRHREWAPALRAAGIPHRRVYDCRHTFATWAIESGVGVLYLARIMGTSVAQIEDTYARWLKRTDDQLRGLLDAYDNAAEG